MEFKISYFDSKVNPMSKLMTRHVYTSESVSEGHPDKVCDQISDTILDACLAQDPKAHVGCETAVGPNLVVNLGEITCKNWENLQDIGKRILFFIRPYIGDLTIFNSSILYYEKQRIRMWM
jgi:hypothetical protein